VTRTLRTPRYWIQLSFAFAFPPTIVGINLIGMRSSTSGGYLAGGIVIILAGISGAIRIARTAVTLDVEGISRSGPLKSRFWRWEDVADIEIRRDPWIGIMAAMVVRDRSGRGRHLGLGGAHLGEGRRKLEGWAAELRALARQNSPST